MSDYQWHYQRYCFSAARWERAWKPEWTEKYPWYYVNESKAHQETIRRGEYWRRDWRAED